MPQKQTVLSSSAQKTPPTANICNRLPCNGAAKAWLIDDADELPWPELENLNSLGISAGASAPEYLVDEVIAELKNIIRILRFMIL